MLAEQSFQLLESKIEKVLEMITSTGFTNIHVFKPLFRSDKFDIGFLVSKDETSKKELSLIEIGAASLHGIWKNYWNVKYT